MGISSSVEKHIIKHLPDSVIDEINSNMIVFKLSDSQYVVSPNYKKDYDKDLEMYSIDYEEPSYHGISDRVVEYIMRNYPVFRTGKLPLTNFRIIATDVDCPVFPTVPFGLMSGGLTDWAYRDVYRAYNVIADFMDAEFDVTHYLSHYITDEIKQEFNKNNPQKYANAIL